MQHSCASDELAVLAPMSVGSADDEGARKCLSRTHQMKLLITSVASSDEMVT
jgi:hypothetical protein